MKKMLVGLARVAGRPKCAQIAPAAMRVLSAIGLAVPMMFSHTGVAVAKRYHEVHGVHGSKSTMKARRSKHRSYAKFSSPMKLGAATHSHESSSSRRSNGVQVASIGSGLGSLPEAADKLAGLSKISWGANARPDCLPSKLKPILSHIAEHFGTVRVNSTCRSREHNRRVGGASRSYHLIGQAVDFRLNGNASAALRYLRTTSAGGIKHYGGGVFHIDTGPRRTW